MALTRLGLAGGPRPPYGSFASKTQTANPAGPHPVGRLTRLGLHGGPRPLYGDFDGKNEAVVVVDERNRGAWIDPAVLRKLRKQAQGDRRKPYDAKKRKERQRVEELTALYEQITGTEIAEQVADIIRPAVQTEALIPSVGQIDMVAIARNAEMLTRLERLVTEYAEEQEDEELLLLAMVH